MRTAFLFSIFTALTIAACGGATASGGSDPNGSSGSGSASDESGTGASGASGANSPGAMPTSPSNPPCEYDKPPPPNSDACPKTWQDACRSPGVAFTCPNATLECWYANVGDETSRGCYAHGLMRCGEWSDGDGGTHLSRSCAQ